MNYPNFSNNKHHNIANALLYESGVQVKPDPKTF